MRTNAEKRSLRRLGHEIRARNNNDKKSYIRSGKNDGGNIMKQEKDKNTPTG